MTPDPPFAALHGVAAEPPHASRRFFLLLLAFAFAALCVLAWPLAPVLLFAAVLASSLTPLYDKLNAKMRGHRQIAGVVFVVAFSVVVLAPFLFALVSAVNDIVVASQSLSERLEREGVEGLVQRLPHVVQERLLALDIDTVVIRDRLGAASGRVLAGAGAFLKATSDLLFSIGMLLIALVVFLIEGPRIVQWLDEALPLERGQTAEIMREFRRISTSVIVGNFGTSAIQAVVALVGFLIARAPSPVVLTMLTFILSFVPAVGGAGMCLAVAGFLALSGHLGSAIFLGIWAIAVVGVVDNIVKPRLVKRGSELHGALVFFAIICGIAAFGVSGLFLGPLIVTFGLTLVRIYRRDFKAVAPPAT